MVDGSVNFISNPNSRNNSQNSRKKLTAQTKALLNDLGVDISRINTEEQGQTILAAVQTKQDINQKKIQSAQKISQESITNEVKDLAAQLGISVSDIDTTAEILNKISNKINEMKDDAEHDQAKLQSAKGYEAKYENLSQNYMNMQFFQAQINNTMSNLAVYNKAVLNL